MSKILKSFLRIFLATISLATLGFVILVIHVMYHPLPDEREEMQQVINQEPESISMEQINTELIPLAKKLIFEKYPILQSRSFGKIHILEENNFVTEVSKELASPEMTTEQSRQIAVSVEGLEGISFCPGGEIYIKFSENNISRRAYMHHITHELLHSVTCSKGAYFALPSVWEESFTDYLTSKVTSDADGAFPKLMYIMHLLSEHISEDELLAIYRFKDEKGLKNSIENKLGKGTYQMLYDDMEIIYRESDNPRADEAMIRVEELLASDKSF